MHIQKVEIKHAFSGVLIAPITRTKRRLQNGHRTFLLKGQNPCIRVDRWPVVLVLVTETAFGILKKKIGELFYIGVQRLEDGKFALSDSPHPSKKQNVHKKEMKKKKLSLYRIKASHLAGVRRIIIVPPPHPPSWWPVYSLSQGYCPA